MECTRQDCHNILKPNQKKFCGTRCFFLSKKGHAPTNYKGGRLVHKGYVYILVKDHPNGDRDGYVLEHRLVMEKHIGRFLDSKEVVHHKNKNRGDNRIENLELEESQASHMREHYPAGQHIYKEIHPMKGRQHSAETRAKLKAAWDRRRAKKLMPTSPNL